MRAVYFRRCSKLLQQIKSMSVSFLDEARSKHVAKCSKDFELMIQELPFNLVLELHSFILAEIPHTWKDITSHQHVPESLCCSGLFLLLNFCKISSVHDN